MSQVRRVGIIERIDFLWGNKNLNEDEIFKIISHGKKCYRISGHIKYYWIFKDQTRKSTRRCGVKKLAVLPYV